MQAYISQGSQRLLNFTLGPRSLSRVLSIFQTDLSVAVASCKEITDTLAGAENRHIFLFQTADPRTTLISPILGYGQKSEARDWTFTFGIFVLSNERGEPRMKNKPKGKQINRRPENAPTD